MIYDFTLNVRVLDEQKVLDAARAEMLQSGLSPADFEPYLDSSEPEAVRRALEILLDPGTKFQEHGLEILDSGAVREESER